MIRIKSKHEERDSLFQITWTRQLDPGGAKVSPTGEVQAVEALGRDAAGSPALAIVSAAGKYEILTVAEMTHISDDRFIITSAAVNNVSKQRGDLVHAPRHWPGLWDLGSPRRGRGKASWCVR